MDDEPRMKRRAAVATGLLALLGSWLFLGCYRDREFGTTHLFIKHRPTPKLIFRAPLGEADRSPTPGHEGYLTPEQEREEQAYVDFVEAHRGRARSVPLPW